MLAHAARGASRAADDPRGAGLRRAGRSRRLGATSRAAPARYAAGMRALLRTADATAT